LEKFSNNPPAGLEVVAGDVTDGGFVRSLVKDQHVVFHLAALIPIPYSFRAPQSFINVNVLGTQNVLEACRSWNVKRMIHTSTSEVYGTARHIPMGEDHPLNAQSPYAASKIGADQLALSYQRSFSTPVTIVRPFNTFGPRQSARAVIPTVLTGLLSGAPVLTLGSKRPVRDFTYVKDTARGFLMAAASGVPGEVYHLGQGRGWSVAEVVRLCAQAVGCPQPKIQTDAQRIRPGASEVWRLVSDARKARKALGWTPLVPFESGLSETAAFVRANLGDYKIGQYTV
jgi:dTDP-glucose 4,6-dehydratase